MTTIKLIFKPSTVRGKEGSLFLRVTCCRQTKLINTKFKIFPTEWDFEKSAVIVPDKDTNRHSYLEDVSCSVEETVRILNSIIARFESKGMPFDVAMIVNAYLDSGKLGFVEFANRHIAKLREFGSGRKVINYLASVNRFSGFLDDADIPIYKVDSTLIRNFETSLKKDGLCPNTISFYMRNLRAIYNRCVEEGLTADSFPFRHVYTGVAKTVKRAIPLAKIKAIKDMRFPGEPLLDFARDVFMLSFYTRGMSVIDLAYLKKKDLSNGYLTYRRMKTGQRLTVKWERQMQEIADKYDDKESPYLLPIIKSDSEDPRKRYRSQAALINRRLREIGIRAGLSSPLTLYVARHSWASAAHSNNVPISVISEGMGHDSEKTTRIYLASLDTSSVDNANEQLINLLSSPCSDR